METRFEVINWLKQLEGVAWFSLVGHPLAMPPPKIFRVSRVDSWESALEVMESRGTDEFLTESRNELYRERTEELCRALGIDPRRWSALEFNACVAELRPHVKVLVTSVVREAAVPPAVKQKLGDILNWMILIACVMCQFDELIQEHRLYEYMTDLLKAGHCVCGWEGEYPAGNLVVY